MNVKKYMVIGAILIMGIAMMGMQAGATAPRYMKLVYQPGTLQVTILHFSPAPKIHYVYKVDVEKNNVASLSTQYTSQPKIFFYTYTYNITAATGDVLTVTATCVLFGHLTRSITV
jgi:hypothetical protein